MKIGYLGTLIGAAPHRREKSTTAHNTRARVQWLNHYEYSSRSVGSWHARPLAHLRFSVVSTLVQQGASDARSHFPTSPGEFAKSCTQFISSARTLKGYSAGAHFHKLNEKKPSKHFSLVSEENKGCLWICARSGESFAYRRVGSRERTQRGVPAKRETRANEGVAYCGNYRSAPYVGRSGPDPSAGPTQQLFPCVSRAHYFEI